MSVEIPAWEDPRRVLARHGLAPKRGFSQNFLVSRSAVERIALALQLTPGERVIELGPGLGTLTAELLRTGAEVTALDADRDMLAVLQAELGAIPSLHTVFGDAANVDVGALSGGQPIKVAGNLPYAITGAIFRCLVAQRALVKRAVVMVQKEVRDRMLARPGEKQYGALTVFTRAAFRPSSVCIVPAGAFFPPPRVDSAVIALDPIASEVAPEHEGFVDAVRCAFEARRKTLRNALQLRFPVDVAERALAQVGIDAQRRGETLSVEEFWALGNALR